MSNAVATQFDLVRAALLAAADAEAAERDNRYHKYEGYRSYGIKRDPFNAIMRELRSGLRSLDLDERMDLALRLVETGIEEEAKVALWLLRDAISHLSDEHIPYLGEFTDGIASWSSTDEFSVHVMQPLLKAQPEPFLELLWRWNQSDERWKQRASVVTLTRRAADEGDFLEETLKLCEQLIWSEDDLVRKGVGWALRDAMPANKALVLPYVTDLRRRGVSSVITLYALRDIEGEERQRVLAVKKR